MQKLLDNFIPSHYDLNFTLDKAQKLLTGTTTIHGEAKTTPIKLHAKSLDISSVLVNDQPAQFTPDQNQDTLVIQAPNPGPVTIQISYTHTLDHSMQGAYLSTYQHKNQTETIVTTQFQSHYARECFPCIDEPAAKATFDLTITTDATDTVLSNMPAKKTQKSKNQPLQTINFATTPKMSTYLVAFISGKLQSHQTTSEHGVTVTTYASLAQSPTHLQFATDFSAKTLDFFDDLFQVPYPLPKLDQVALPDFEAGAMENWGLATYRENALLCDQNSALDQQLYVASVLAHENSHQWFGNLVTMQWWDDLWLNESFASLIEAYAVDKIAPQLEAWDDYYAYTILPALRRDCLPGVQAVKCDVSDPAEIPALFDPAIVYSKGSHLLLMLMRLMGETNFFAGLAEYFRQHSYGCTVANDLWNALTPHADFDVKSLMTPWLIQPGFPVFDQGKQHRFLITSHPKEPNYTYPLPEVKDDLSGHYIINLSPTQLQTALQNLNSLDLEQTLRLLIDRQLLAKTPLATSASLLELLVAFPHQTKSIVWDVMSFIISDLKFFFTPDTAPELQFKTFIQQLAAPQYNRLSVAATKNDSDNDTRLRPTILGHMTYAEDPSFLAAIQKHYADIPPHQIDPNLRATILFVQIKHDLTDADSLFQLYQTTPDAELQNDLILALTASQHPDTLQSYLDFIKSDSIRPNHRIIFFGRLIRNQLSTTPALDWLYQNWDWLYEVEGEKTIDYYIRYAASQIRTDADFQTFQKFFTSKLSDPAIARNIEIALAEIPARLHLITTDTPKLHQTLKILLKK